MYKPAAFPSPRAMRDQSLIKLRVVAGVEILVVTVVKPFVRSASRGVCRRNLWAEGSASGLTAGRSATNAAVVGREAIDVGQHIARRNA
jgi:hypothetical protein